ncbi:MAG TPA: 1,4-dihydroxy-2-naphthoate octaprenyltransferase [Catalimonadaceae bacterium]|nr:1,4-dihydroxy-2-naphthoate octaprenyltransferase [Catalimonadaceae bacterium]HPI10313.1 1,4-dihydroxy-2-naphthoate octaprenyltransferase [Catalimonadaceae bacterium]
MSLISIWIQAARPRTLPLALAATGMGNLLVFKTSNFQISICLLSILTTLFLQILSNFANDYGDSIHGADNDHRKGPSRAVQSGKVSRSGMKSAIYLFIALSLVSGIGLLFFSFQTNWAAFFPVLFVGLLAIAAAYFYTNGSKPYGYMALGDVSVFLFFGLVAVLATQYLHTLEVPVLFILPACSLGFWSTAVLNVNNMRDMDSDRNAGKLTIPLQLGIQNAKKYQTILVAGGILSLATFGIFTESVYVIGALPGVLLMLKALSGVWKTSIQAELDAYLKPQAVGTFLAVLGMAILKAIL